MCVCVRACARARACVYVLLSLRSADVNPLIPVAPASERKLSEPVVLHHRVVRHERFRNMTLAQARAYLEPLEVGEHIVRCTPSARTHTRFAIPLHSRERA